MNSIVIKWPSFRRSFLFLPVPIFAEILKKIAQCTKIIPKSFTFLNDCVLPIITNKKTIQ